MLNWGKYIILFGVIFAFSFVLQGNSLVKTKTSVVKPQVSINYFYVNACGSCNEAEKFRQKYNSIIGELDDNVNVELNMFNTFKIGEAELMKKFFNEFKVPEEKRQVPILFINGTYLTGTNEIDTRLKTEFEKALHLGGKASGMTVTNTENAALKGFKDTYRINENKSSDSVLVYFYITSCEDCNKVSKILKAFKNQYIIDIEGKKVISNIKLKRFNAGEATNVQLLKLYFEYYKVPEKDQKVPIIFTGSTWFSGSEAVKSKLEKTVSKGEGVRTFELDKLSNKKSSLGIQTNSLSGYGVLGVVGTGLVNGLNPCSLSMVLFFLSLIVVRNINVLRAGICFILGKLIMFFFLGTLLYKLFLEADIVWFQPLTKAVIALLAMVFVVLNVLDMVSAKQEKYGKIKLQLPERLRRLNHYMVKAICNIESEKVFLPLSFLLGIIIAAGEFLCTGQIYLATIVLAVQKSTSFDSQATLYFILYGIAFVLPLFLVTMLIYKGKGIFMISEAIRVKMPLIKMINALVFFLFTLLTIVLY